MLDLNLTSANALFDRAKTHEINYRKITSGALWKIGEDWDKTSGDWTYTLHLDRERLIACKPVLGDCANNLNSALDNIISAMARAHGTPRSRSLYYPIGLDNQKFHDDVEKMEPRIGQAMVGVIIDNHTKHIHDVPHLFAVKKMANTAKHWELLPARASALAIAVNNPNGKQTIFQIPKETFHSADFFEYHRCRDRLPKTSHRIVIKLIISGLGDNIQNGPDTSLTCANRYIEGLLKAAKVAAGGH